MNAQPVKFIYKDNKVTAKVPEKINMQLVDLGIAKLHFELGAGGGKWEFGNGGTFCK